MNLEETGGNGWLCGITGMIGVRERERLFGSNECVWRVVLCWMR